MITDNDRRIAEEATDKYLSRLADRPENEAYIRFALPNIILAAIAEAKKPLEEDAARYRYLRLVWEEWTGTSWTGNSNDVASKLDAAIDAVRAREGKS